MMGYQSENVRMRCDDGHTFYDAAARYIGGRMACPKCGSFAVTPEPLTVAGAEDADFRKIKPDPEGDAMAAKFGAVVTESFTVSGAEAREVFGNLFDPDEPVSNESVPCQPAAHIPGLGRVDIAFACPNCGATYPTARVCVACQAWGTGYQTVRVSPTGKAAEPAPGEAIGDDYEARALRMAEAMVAAMLGPQVWPALSSSVRMVWVAMAKAAEAAR